MEDTIPIPSLKSRMGSPETPPCLGLRARPRSPGTQRASRRPCYSRRGPCPGVATGDTALIVRGDTADGLGEVQEHFVNSFFSR
jgi:hypothetical protein